MIRTYSYNATYFDSFGVEYVSKEMKNFIRNKNIAINIYRNKHIMLVLITIEYLKKTKVL